MIHDVIGVGFGPSNIALAIAMEESGRPCSTLYLESNTQALWHEGMLLDGADIQNNPLRDLVTPVNPRSRYSFTNYLHESGNLFRYLNLGVQYPLRRDYCRYVKWVADQFSDVRYGERVTRMEVRDEDGAPVWSLQTDDREYLARSVVLGIGRNINIPPGFEQSDNVVHLSRFLPALQGLSPSASIVVIGGSQSAVEILLHLLDKGFENIHSVHRGFSFRLKDTSPFSDEVYFPEFVDYYHALPPAKRALLDAQVRQTNYSSADGDVLHRLYLRMYELEMDGYKPLRILRNHRIAGVQPGRPVVLDLEELYTSSRQRLDADLVVLATGYLDVGRNGKDGLPYLLQDMAPTFRWSSDYLEVGRDYRVMYTEDNSHLPPLYLNGLCESSHGLGDAGSFSLVSLRARDILRSLSENVLENVR